MRSGSASGAQHRHVEAAQREQVALDQRGVRERGAAPRRPRAGGERSQAERLRMTAQGSLAAPWATLKDRLNADLHAAMKARDELITSTLRMALAAVRTAEVAGKPRPRAVRRRGARGADQGGQEAARGGRGVRRRRAGPSRPSEERAEEEVLAATCRRSSPTRRSPSSSRPRSPRRRLQRQGADGPGHEGGPGRGGRPGRGRPGGRRGPPPARLTATSPRRRRRCQRGADVAVDGPRRRSSVPRWVVVAPAAHWAPRSVADRRLGRGRGSEPGSAWLRRVRWPLLGWITTTPPLMVRAARVGAGGRTRRAARVDLAPSTTREAGALQPCTWRSPDRVSTSRPGCDRWSPNAILLLWPAS